MGAAHSSSAFRLRSQRRPEFRSEAGVNDIAPAVLDKSQTFVEGWRDQAVHDAAPVHFAEQSPSPSIPALEPLPQQGVEALANVWLGFTAQPATRTPRPGRRG